MSRLRLLDSGDAIFFKFLEAYVHPLVRRDAEEQQTALAWINRLLEYEGLHLAPQDGSPWGTYRVQPKTGGAIPSAPVYEVVLSFAGEQRPYVNHVAQHLRASDVEIFYDSYEVANLWGKNLSEHFHQVYGGSSRFCVMFISSASFAIVREHYVRQCGRSDFKFLKISTEDAGDALSALASPSKNR